MGRVKSLEEIKAMIRERTGKQGVFRCARSQDVESVLERLNDKDPDHWATEWSRVARPYEDEGARYELAGRGQEACAAYLMAHTYYTLGRYPVPHSPGKKESFRKSLELFVKAGLHFNPPLEALRIP